MPIIHSMPVSVETINYNVTTDLDMHDYRIKNVAEATTAKDALRLNSWTTWTPTLTWSGPTPTGVSKVARYVRIGKTIFWTVKVTATDGFDTTGLTISLPASQADNTHEFHNSAYERYSVSWHDPMCYTLGDLIQFHDFELAHAGDPLEVSASGFYEV